MGTTFIYCTLSGKNDIHLQNFCKKLEFNSNEPNVMHKIRIYALHTLAKKLGRKTLSKKLQALAC